MFNTVDFVIWIIVLPLPTGRQSFKPEKTFRQHKICLVVTKLFQVAGYSSYWSNL